MQNKLIGVSLLLLSLTAIAAPTSTVAAAAAPAPVVLVNGAPESLTIGNNATAKPPTQALTVNSSVMQQADQDFNKLNALKRQAAIADAQAKLNPVRNNTNAGGSGKNSSPITETIATNIVVDGSGMSFATLQFLDGSTLNVDVGSKIGKYEVSSISMTGVQLTSCNGKGKCSKPILIKRAYPLSPSKINNMSSQSTTIFPAATPNSNAGDGLVPPISSM